MPSASPFDRYLPFIVVGSRPISLYCVSTVPIAWRQGLVVGLPLDDRGEPTAQAVHCRRYGHRLAKALGLPGLGQ